MPVAKYLLNNITFGTHDPLVSKLRDSGYSVFENPLDATSVVVSFPVSWEDIRFNNNRYNKELNFESAIDQLERYKKLMNSYVEQNCSITVSYDPSEIHLIIDWLLDNWDNYVGVSWMLRVDPSLTHLELGHPFLPQEAVTKKVFDEYVAKLKPVDMGGTDSFEEVGIEECSTGACPVK
jgi:ribonucleoside-triphosphate reductase